ncbi:MAG: hypothetical protein E2O39_11690 [Planctomycetota bacterium]|nr:MAG: hypothetical protein E2O39_11690 [Planctomycetota bacterium]
MTRSGSTLFVGGMVAGVLVALIVEEVWPAAGEPDIEHYRDVRDFVRESFVREVSNEELLDHALHGMVAALDEYSRYYNRAESIELERETTGRYTGIGVVFRRPIADGQVLFALADSPAERAGVRVGDRFLAVDGRPIPGITETELRELIDDPEQGALEIVVLGLDGARRELRIRPDSVVDPTVRHARLIGETRSIGYVSILSFSRQTPAEFGRAFEFLTERGMQALVIDLRRNYGGVLDSAEEIANRFIPPGAVIVSVEGRGEPVVRRSGSSAGQDGHLPLVLLVDGGSASASEVLAGALQDHLTAVVVGSPTYGKGMVQTIRKFRETETRAKVTTAYYYSPTHRNFERTVDPGREHGILPDVEIPIGALEQREIHSFLARYSPPLDAIPAIEAWEAAEGTKLIERHPADAQLDAAIALLAGHRPGPQPALEDK